MLLLRDVDFESIRGLLEDCPIQQVKRGEVLIHAEKPNQFLYLLVSGRLRIHLKLELDSIAILEPGEVVGELSLIDRQLTSACVVAECDCSLRVLDEESLWSLVDVLPHFTQSIICPGQAFESCGFSYFVEPGSAARIRTSCLYRWSYQSV